MSNTQIFFTATWKGKDATQVRPTQMGEKVRVDTDETIEVEQSIANRLRRESNWLVDDVAIVKDAKHEGAEDKEPELTEEEKAEAAKAERIKAIKKMDKPALDAYIAEHPTIPQDLKNNEEKKTAIVGFEFEGLYPVTPVPAAPAEGAAQ